MIFLWIKRGIAVVSFIVLLCMFYYSYLTLKPSVLWNALYTTTFKEAHAVLSQLQPTQIISSRLNCFDIFYKCGVQVVATTALSYNEVFSLLQEKGWRKISEIDGKVLYTILALDTNINSEELLINGSRSFPFEGERLIEPTAFKVKKGSNHLQFFEKTSDSVIIQGKELNENVIELWIQIRPK
jgi:hypothetical protein